MKDQTPADVAYAILTYEKYSGRLSYSFFSTKEAALNARGAGASYEIFEVSLKSIGHHQIIALPVPTPKDVV